MATEYGMTRLGLARRPVSGPNLPDDVLDVVNELLADALTQARAQLEEHRPLLRAIAEELLERETLRLADLRAIAKSVNPIPVQREAAHD
jgi:ATP-dependent Zn protease